MGTTPHHRTPRRPVWITEKTFSRPNARRGQPKKYRRVLVRWIVDGRTCEKSFADPVEAGRFAATKEDELEGRIHQSLGSDALFSEWTDLYLGSRFAEYESPLRTARVSYADKYLILLVATAKKFIGLAGDRRLNDYRTSDFERFRTDMNRTREISPITTEGHLARLRTIFRAAWKEQLIARPPEIKVHDLPYEKPVMEPEEIRDIFEVAKHWPEDRPGQRRQHGDIQGRLYPILATLYYTMIRRGELVHIMWDDLRKTARGEHEILIHRKEWDEVDSEGKRISMLWEPKDREARAIPVHPALLEVLEDLRMQTSGSPWVFTNTKGKRWSTGALASLLVRFQRSTGIETGFHIWRRSGLTHLHDAGVPPGQIQEIAGHSSLDTTMRYVRPNAKHRHEAIQALPTV